MQPVQDKPPHRQLLQDLVLRARQLPRKWLPAVVFLLGLTVAWILLVSKPRPAPVPPPPPPPPVVLVVHAEPADTALGVSTQGTVQARREINIVSQVSGLVQRVDAEFAAGGFFGEGAELLKVEDEDYRFAEVRAEAAVADAVQLVALEKGRARQAEREWHELGSLEANELFLRKPQLAAAEEALRAAGAELDEARLQLRRTSIRAPFNGRILEKFVDVGQYITPGTAVARVHGTDVAEVRLPLTDRQLALLELPLDEGDHSQADEGPPVILRARFAGADWEWRGRVVRTEAAIDVDSRVVYAVAAVDKPYRNNDRSEGRNNGRSEGRNDSRSDSRNNSHNNGRNDSRNNDGRNDGRNNGNDRRPPLAVGMFVHAEIEGRELPDVARLPRAALQNDGSVLLVDAEDRLRSRAVRVLKTNPEFAWVQGLQRAERVVVQRPALAVTGMAVTVERFDMPAGGDS